jgi:uncharacterized DUF497 family protein
MDEFEWDDNKNLANIEKHGIDFEDAISVFLGPTLEAPDDRLDYGEVRIISYGEMNGRVVAVVYTMRGDICRIISARKASRDERTKYYSAIAAQPPDRSD